VCKYSSCLAYTGPFSDLLTCPYCDEPRYKAPSSESHRCKNVHIPRQQFHTIPIGPQIQAQWRSPAGAREAKYHSHCTKELLSFVHPESGDLKIDIYDDFLQGFDYLQAVANGDITSDDMVLLFSFDGAQLYKNKQSDCWIMIWVLLDLHPDTLTTRSSKSILLSLSLARIIHRMPSPFILLAYIILNLILTVVIETNSLKFTFFSRKE
jgi:hypothetical protein